MAPLRDFDHLDDAQRVQSPRPETPEPDSRQGRRNAETGVQLLDVEGRISDKFERCLAHIFAKYCNPRPAAPSRRSSSLPRQRTQSEATTLLVPPPDAYLTQVGLDRWAKDTNGTAFSEETKDEMKGFLDVTEAGNLTFKGFLQIYQVQTENDEEETWRDLSSHGFDRTLTLVTSRREDLDIEEPIDKTQVQPSTLVEGASA
ncbi:hypothetical protein SCHPADRAFT_929112 [Schizopora paradoxa]|uniref:EF-hand domain-containing protein n=1 Tax=Schizopora paradoxa TaxID=27342 RepID=A0A0H2RLY4_9AGAM|nr:hypothetical protein SCHPADRAFT_929112 [Schizopora paradoxa]